jgi:hypothetical protein
MEYFCVLHFIIFLTFTTPIIDTTTFPETSLYILCNNTLRTFVRTPLIEVFHNSQLYYNITFKTKEESRKISSKLPENLEIVTYVKISVNP